MAAKQHDRANRQIAGALVGVLELAKGHVDAVLSETKPVLDVAGSEELAVEKLITSFVGESFANGRKLPSLPYAQHATCENGSRVAWIGIDHDLVDDTSHKIIATIDGATTFAPQCTAVALPIISVLRLMKARLVDARRAGAGENPEFTAIVPGGYLDAAKRDGRIGDVGRDSPQRFGEILRIAEGEIDGENLALRAAERILGSGRPQFDSLDEKILKMLANGEASLRQIKIRIGRAESPTRKRLRRLMNLDPPRVERARRGFYRLPKR